MDISKTRVEIRMGESGLTQKALAERSGIRPQNLSTILRRGTATPLTVLRIATGLDCDPADIIEEGS